MHLDMAKEAEITTNLWHNASLEGRKEQKKAPVTIPIRISVELLSQTVA